MKKRERTGRTVVPQIDETRWIINPSRVRNEYEWEKWRVTVADRRECALILFSVKSRKKTGQLANHDVV